MSFLLNVVNDLSDFQKSVQSWTNDRLVAANQTVFGGNGKDPLFDPAALANVRANVAKFKAGVDPRIRNGATNSSELGNSTLGSNSQDVGTFFNLLPTMDVWAVQQQATALRGLVGGRIPTIPMVFAVTPALSAESADVPEPLFLFINPKTWARSTNKITTNQYVRNGILSERWGDDLEQITATGSIGAYYTLETGLTRFYRRQTPSYRNLMMLLQIFKNNGCVYDTDYQGSVPAANKRVIDVGAVEIFYDKEIFRGTFDSFSVKEAADKPYSLEYSFTFIVETSTHISDITPTTTSFNDSTSANFGPGAVTLAPNQQLGDAEALADQRLQQQLSNQAAITADKASEILQQNKLNSLRAVSPEAGFQPSTAQTSILLQEQLDAIFPKK